MILINVHNIIIIWQKILVDRSTKLFVLTFKNHQNIIIKENHEKKNFLWKWLVFLKLVRCFMVSDYKLSGFLTYFFFSRYFDPQVMMFINISFKYTRVTKKPNQPQKTEPLPRKKYFFEILYYYNILTIFKF